jgi:acetyl esterase/lipase
VANFPAYDDDTEPTRWLQDVKENWPDRFQDRTDENRWAYPGLKEHWGVGQLTEVIWDILDPAKSLEQSEAFAGRFREMAAAMVAPATEEEMAALARNEYEVDVTGVDPGAPATKVVAYAPKDRTEPLPAILLLPGGGLAIGDSTFYEPDLRALAREFHAVVFASNYRCPKRWKAPAAINDCHATYVWMVENAEELGVNPDQVLVYGISSGGTMAAALAHRLVRAGYPRNAMPRGVFVLWGPLDDREFVPSRNIVQVPWNNANERVSWRAYLGDYYNRYDVPPDIVPGHAAGDDFKGMPPVFVHASEHDQDRDDQIRWAQGLWQAGVFCELMTWGGCAHSLPRFDFASENHKRFSAMVSSQLRDCLANDLRRR